MSRIYTPLDHFAHPGNSLCVWLNGAPQAERPWWIRVWNEARRRFATDGAANLLLPRARLGQVRLPDVISGDFDSIDEATAEFFRTTDGVTIHATPDQDKTDFTKALELARAYRGDCKCPPGPRITAVIVLGGLSGRFDHTLATLHSLLVETRMTLAAREHCPIYVTDGENLVFVVDEGAHRVEMPRRLLTGVCGFVPFSQRRTVVSTTGYKWDVEERELEFGGLISTSNELAPSDTAHVGAVELMTSAPLALTFELTHETTQQRGALYGPDEGGNSAAPADP